MNKFETALQFIPVLAEKIWAGHFSITSSYHAKSNVYQVHCHRHPDSQQGPFVFLTAEGKDIEEASENLFKQLRIKCKEHWDAEIKLFNEAEKRMQSTENMVRKAMEKMNELGAGAPATDPLAEGT